ncbi:SGNH/GDSL hydrolase family protein [candidate division KSB1 bacterium]|nr:SGNH/GDSL hydrolase family protein [candidate division KSB1 bacterium]
MSRKFIFFCVFLTSGSLILLLVNSLADMQIIANIWLKICLFMGLAGILLGIDLRIFLDESRANSIISKLIVLSITILILLVMSEVAVRIAFRGITTTADDTSYFALRWNWFNVRFNKLQFREREFDIAKADSIYRIAIIGDSFAYGQGIPIAERFSNLIGTYLEAKRCSVACEVLNFGRSGAETVDHLEILNSIVLKTRPDFVLLQWFVNDVEGHDKSGRPGSMTLAPSDELHAKLQSASALYFLVSLQWYALQEALGWAGSYSDYISRRFSDPQCLDSQESNRALKQFIQSCQDNDIRMGIVLFPDVVGDLNANYPFAFLHERVIAICDEESTLYVDLRDPFSKEKEYRKLWVNQFDRHPSSLANRLAADCIIEKFKSIWLAGAGCADGDLASDVTE